MIGIGIGTHSSGARRGPNLITNGGASGTTDWTDTNTDGIADDWELQSGAGTPAIVTGNGFTGNAQRIPHVTGTLTRFRQIIGGVGTIGDTYGFKMKYRTDWAEAWRIYACGVTEAIDMNLAINAGNAISYSGEVTLASAANMILNFYNLGANPSCFIEIDEILFYKK